MSQTFKAFTSRDSFKVISRDLLRWFPGHMDKGLKQMQQKLKLVDLVIEVHDARIPFSGRNNIFQSTITPIKPHIFVLNKKDLAPPAHFGKIKEILKAQGIQNFLFTNCKDEGDKGVKLLHPMMQDLILNSDRYNRRNESDYNVMIIGVPNVGKSSLINKLRNKFLKKGNAAPVGAIPGITRGMQTRVKISENPKMYMFDTPGILTPNVETVEMGLKLALCHCLLDHLVGEEIIADYLLFMLNRKKLFNYVNFMGLKEPSDDIREVLAACAVKNKWTVQIKQFDMSLKTYPNYTEAAKFFITAFRKGTLGSMQLDEDEIYEKYDKLKKNLNVDDPLTLMEKDKVL